MRLLTLIVLSVALASPALGAPPNASEQDRAGIEQAALDYLEGWYTGNPVRMEKALHPELAKRMVATDPKTGRSFLQPIGASAMVMLAARGAGKLKPGDDAGIQVAILDTFGNMAMVRAKSVAFLDYIQLAKVDGQWKIVNVLWEPTPAPVPPAPAATPAAK